MHVQATNLLKAGYKVNVWNRNIAKCEPLRELGAEVKPLIWHTPEIILTCLPVFQMLAATPVASYLILISIQHHITMAKKMKQSDRVHGT